MSLIVKIKRLRQHRLPLPSYQTEGASGMDLMADLEAPFTLAPGTRAAVPTGFAFEIPPGYEGQVRPRSGLAFRSGVSVINAPGTIDSDYRGELKVLLVNLSEETVEIQPGDRIAQLVITPVVHATLQETAELADTRRGPGGFGHTGR
jgi:dUTP pyrophosphatase